MLWVIPSLRSSFKTKKTLKSLAPRPKLSMKKGSDKKERAKKVGRYPLL